MLNPGMKTKFYGGIYLSKATQIFLMRLPMGDKQYRTTAGVKTIQDLVARGGVTYRSENSMPDGPKKNDMGKNKWIV